MSSLARVDCPDQAGLLYSLLTKRVLCSVSWSSLAYTAPSWLSVSCQGSSGQAWPTLQRPDKACRACDALPKPGLLCIVLAKRVLPKVSCTA
jgi:hypothetical protein